MSPENKVTANYWIKSIIIITTIALLFLFSVIKLVQKFVVPRLWLQLLLVWLFLYCHHDTDICCLHPHRIILKGVGGSVQNALVTFLPSSGQVWCLFEVQEILTKLVILSAATLYLHSFIPVHTDAKGQKVKYRKKVFTTLNDKNRITHDNTGKQVLIQKLVQSSAILNEHNFFDYGMRSHLQTSEMIKGCTVLGCAHQKEQVSKHKHQPSLLPPIKLFHLLNPRQRHR